MELEIDLFFGILACIVGVSLFYDGWSILWRRKRIVALFVRIELWLTKLFQGGSVADLVRKRKTSPEAICRYGISSLILGTATIVASGIFLLEIWAKLRLR